MRIEIHEESAAELDAYARVPIAFRVERALEVTVVGGGFGGFKLRERPVEPPWTKDYDAVAGDPPTAWPSRFDVSNWGFLCARLDGERVGGATIALRTPGVLLLEGRDDLAALWDLRVAPAARGRGVGTRLFEAASAWATTRGYRWLKIETQNINVAACRFYASRGCALRAIDRFAYPDLKGQVQMIWSRELGPAS
jgi:GNAT superfamily N-acetyltransferase